MKTKHLLVTVSLLATFGSPNYATAQTTAFTYQARLDVGGAPANGSYDLAFALFDASGGGTQQGPSLTNAATGVSNGLFTVVLDFGHQFPGAERWLELAVSTNGANAFSILSPRQRVTAAPYAIHAGSASNLLGTVSAGNIGGVLQTSHIPNLDASKITSGTLAEARLSANVSKLGQSIDSAEIVDGTIVNADISAAAAISDSKLATISAAGKVADSALSANAALLNRSSQTFSGTNIFSQRVGIGTAASHSTLRVQGAGLRGDIWLSPATAGGNADIFLSENLNGTFGIILRHNGTNNTLDFVGVNSSVETTQPVVTIGRGNTSGMAIQNNLTVGDSLGVGTNNPSARLHIGGIPGTDGIQFPDGSVQVRAAKVIRFTTPGEWPIQALAAGAATSYSFFIQGVQVGSAVVVTPLTDLGPAIAISQARVWSANNVSFYVQNISNASYDAPSTYFTIAVFE